MSDGLTRRGWPLVVRRARADDETAVLAFASRTWNDWDYIPHAWPRWLAATDGVMLVATTPEDPAFTALDAESKPLQPGEVVAVVRVAIPAPGEAWLEGIRVDPRVRGMDVATDLQVAELHWAAANGAHIVRYATGERNEGSHRLGGRGGFSHICSLRATWWSATGTLDADEHGPSGFDPAVQADARRRRHALLSSAAGAGLVASEGTTADVWRQLESDEGFVAGARLYEPRPWALEELTRSKVAEHVRAGEVLVRSGSNGRAIAIVVGDVAPAEDASLRLAVLTGDADAAWQLVEQLRALAGEPVRFRFADGAPVMIGLEERYRASGYVFPETALHVMARPLDPPNPPPRIEPAALLVKDPAEASILPAR